MVISESGRSADETIRASANELEERRPPRRSLQCAPRNPLARQSDGRRECRPPQNRKATAKKIETENKRGVTFGAWSRSRELGVGGKALTTADLHPWPAEKPRVNGAPALWRAAAP